MVASFKDSDEVVEAISRFIQRSEGTDNIRNAQQSAEIGGRDLTAQIRADKLALDALRDEAAGPTITYLNAVIKIVNPSHHLAISCPKSGIVAISDEGGNAVLINAAENEPTVETVGSVNSVREGVFDLGDADDVDWVSVTTKQRLPKFSS